MTVVVQQRSDTLRCYLCCNLQRLAAGENVVLLANTTQTHPHTCAHTITHTLSSHVDTRHLQVSAQIAAGENVVLLANHQTEADPGVFAHMLADSFPNLATDVIYVAGDRVVTDPLCKPFSMGRNLFCVHR